MNKRTDELLHSRLAQAGRLFLTSIEEKQGKYKIVSILRQFYSNIHYEGIQRVEVFPVPYEAMREAVLNAIVHSDYSHFNPIRIRVYENKVIITNMAKLPEHISFDELLMSRTSFPHNPNIARTFYKCGQIERWGRGINKIKTECKNEGKPEPQFVNREIFFEVQFNVADINEDISSDMRNILDLMREIKNISIPKLADITGLSTKQIEYKIKVLKKKGIIERVGARKNGKWIVKIP